MFLNTVLIAAVAVVPALAQIPSNISVPSLNVPACPKKGTVTYDKSVPDQVAFPRTKVDVCYDDSHIDITFTAYNETNFFVNPNYTTNSPIYQYTAMETFISRGTGDPQTYLEFEIAPNNVTFQAMIYNPSKVRADGAPFDTFYVAEPLVDGLTATTTVNKPIGLWVSSARIPLGFFNVDNGTAHGTQWRMNFFRIITAPSTFPAQFYGAWSQPDEANFHMTPYFGHITFV
ncbi:putative domon-like type 9 carbohydrate-binding module domain [Mycena sanguinolenta]|uniref:Putative domon-like type 9 carbohydrate-binding module domain n=1 Tax=Mycena sanguinolenta TaxID=230812 RepID=A0A8H6YU54_9AGAR|nr:putative domon-like type 9 carbohydrate-binding module domain [Mycena sanguinolenta]